MAATHKMVDGRLVELTQQERDAIEAEWALNRKPPLLVDTLEQRIAALETRTNELERLR